MAVDELVKNTNELLSSEILKSFIKTGEDVEEQKYDTAAIDDLVKNTNDLLSSQILEAFKKDDNKSNPTPLPTPEPEPLPEVLA